MDGAQWSVTNAPAAGATATITRAAVAGKAHVCQSIAGNDTTSPSVSSRIVLRDGASGVGAILWEFNVLSGSGAAALLAPLNILGTSGNAMTLEFLGAPGGAFFQSVALTGIDVD